MTYLHTKNDNKKSILIYFSTLIPLIIYGIYKNGYLLYLNHYISFLNIFKIVYLVLISLLISILIEYLFTKNISFNYSHLDLVIIALFCPYNISILLYSIIILIYRIIDEVFLNKYNINKIALMHLLLALIMFLLGKYSYLNIAEANNIYLLNLGDIILGRGVGGIGTSSIILGILSYGILSYCAQFKKSIPLICYLSYVISISLILIIKHSFRFNYLFMAMPILGFIFVSSNTIATPYKRKEMLIYGVVVGLLTGILTIFMPNEAVFIATIIANIIFLLIEYLAKKKRNLKEIRGI